jgi:hypothetical protein
LSVLKYDSLSHCIVFHYKYYSKIRIKYSNLAYYLAETIFNRKKYTHFLIRLVQNIIKELLNQN